MKNKSLFIIIAVLLLIGFSFLFATREIFAANNIEFRPNVEIPGMQTFFQGLYSRGGNASSGEYYVYNIDGSAWPRYVSALYNYASVIAGVIAMFMLVFASYQWLLAGGNAEKIGRARDTISGTLLGVALLFGGYLLLSQISDNLVNLETVKVTKIPTIQGIDDACASHTPADLACGDYIEVEDQDYGKIYCIGQFCENSSNKCLNLTVKTGTGECAKSNIFASGLPCTCDPTDCTALRIDGCDDYKIDSMCRENTCYDKVDISGNTVTVECGIDADNDEQDCETLGGNFVGLDNVRCYGDADCDWNGQGWWYCDKSSSDAVKGDCKKTDAHP